MQNKCSNENNDSKYNNGKSYGKSTKHADLSKGKGSDQENQQVRINKSSGGKLLE